MPLASTFQIFTIDTTAIVSPLLFHAHPLLVSFFLNCSTSERKKKEDPWWYGDWTLPMYILDGLEISRVKRFIFRSRTCLTSFNSDTRRFRDFYGRVVFARGEGDCIANRKRFLFRIYDIGR